MAASSDRAAPRQVTDDAPEGMIPATFGRKSEPMLPAERRRPWSGTREAEEARACAVDAIAQGHVLRGEMRQSWARLDEAEIERRSRVDRTAPDYVNEDPATIDAFEDSQRRWWASHWVLCTEVETWAPPTKSEGPALSQAAHEVLRGMGLQTVAEQQADPRVCGGALLRHAFTPAESQWLRDGTIQLARCQRCQRDLTRDELLKQAEREAELGTCPTCGDVLETAAEIRSHHSDDVVAAHRRCPHGHG